MHQLQRVVCPPPPPRMMRSNNVPKRKTSAKSSRKIWRSTCARTKPRGWDANSGSTTSSNLKRHKITNVPCAPRSCSGSPKGHQQWSVDRHRPSARAALLSRMQPPFRRNYFIASDLPPLFFVPVWQTGAMRCTSGVFNVPKWFTTWSPIFGMEVCSVVNICYQFVCYFVVA